MVNDHKLSTPVAALPATKSGDEKEFERCFVKCPEDDERVTLLFPAVRAAELTALPAAGVLLLLVLSTIL